VQLLLKESGQALNRMAYEQVAENFDEYSAANPWHICFAIGLCWGHLARLDLKFTGAALRVLENWNIKDLTTAREYHLERGPDPIEQSLAGGHTLFGKVKLPDVLPSDLKRLGTAQQRWLTPILSKERPRYIGSWNATAMFMIALFAQPKLAAALTTPEVLLPPGGPIFGALQLLYRAHVLVKPPEGSELDDQSFEPGALYVNNSLFSELQKGVDDWSLVDVHSGLYMLGTRYAASNSWF
jgi:hypothetical protein